MAYLCTSRAGWLAAEDCFRMSKSLALKASQRIRDLWSDWASDVGHFNCLWKVRCIKGQDEVLCVQHLSIPPYCDTPNITDVLDLHVLFDFLSRHVEKIRWAVACFADDASRNKSPESILRIYLTSPILLVKAFSIRKGETLVKVSGVLTIKKRNESQNLREWCSTEGDFRLGSMSVLWCSPQYASTHHGAQQGEAARRSSDMRQARHLPQRWYWSIVVQVRDVIRQFTQGIPNCNTNPKATVFGIPKEPVVESAELITSRLTGAGSLLPPVYGEAWAKGHATGTPDSTFPRVRNCSQHRFTTLETISNYRNSYPGFSSGRPRGTTPADDRYIVLQARRNRRQTAGEIARHTTQATGRPISRFTVARRLHGGGLFARRPVRCVPLTPAHRRRRSLWCREHRNWRDNEWGRVLFTDESRFSLSSDSHRILIWRERGSRNYPSNIIERDRYGGRGVLVWGGIMLGSRTDLHIFDAGSVNGTRYCNEILLPYVRLFRGAMGLQFLFMDDNAPCHRTVAAKQLLESEDIERMDWPARSPDLNPIEHVWDFLGRRLAARTYHQ
ncbi:transposable element Tc1 transposase [Trichonephila clavipes]|nr:transposable element Tc1 transposase [Trichonephila clavipes]